MFVVSQAKVKRNKFIIRTNPKIQPLTTNPPIKPKATTYFGCQLQQSLGESSYIKKDIHMNQPFTSGAKLFIKKKIKFRFSVVRSQPQVKKHLKRDKELKTKYRRINQDHNYCSGRWKLDEHKRFVEAIVKYGNDWKEVQRCVKTRSCTQARSHAQKFFLKVRRAKLLKFNLDLSKTSMKLLHDFVSKLSGEEYDKTLQALNNVAFEKMEMKDEKSKRKSSTNGFDSSDHESQEDEEMSEINNDDICNWDKLISSGFPSENPYCLSTKTRTISIDIDDQAPIRMNRGSVNSLEGFYQSMGEDKDFNNEIREKEYRKNFDNTFMMPINKESNNYPILPSRKVSLEDDFQYNYLMQL